MTEHNFKVGDKVKVIKSGMGIGSSDIDKETIITDVDEEGYDGDGGVKVKDFKNGAYEDWIGEGTFELIKSNYKPKAPTHIVVWDEGCGDPAKFFSDKKEAQDYAKKLSENPKNSNIIFAEVSNVKSVEVKKTLTYKDHKI